MEEQLISFETAKLAKEKLFPQSRKAKGKFRDDGSTENLGIGGAMVDTCKEWYERPTQSLLAKWLREKYDIEINITRMPPEAIKFSSNKRIKKYSMWVWSLNGNPRIENPSLFFDNYEEAYEIGLQEALKLIK